MAEPLIIQIHSYKGGVGKSWFSLNTAKSLCDRGKRVLLIEADFVMPTFVSNFQEMAIDLHFNDYLNQKDRPISDFIYPSLESDFGLIACASNAQLTDPVFSNNQSWFYSKLKQLKNDIQNLNYDIVIFDMGPGFSLFLVNALFIASTAIIISRPDLNSINGTQFLLNTIYSKIGHMEKVDIHVIINQVPELEKFDELLRQWKVEIGIKYNFVKSVNSLPLDPEIIYQSAINEFYIKTDSNVLNKFNQLINTFVN